MRVEYSSKFGLSTYGCVKCPEIRRKLLNVLNGELQSLNSVAIEKLRWPTSRHKQRYCEHWIGTTALDLVLTNSTVVALQSFIRGQILQHTREIYDQCIEKSYFWWIENIQKITVIVIYVGLCHPSFNYYYVPETRMGQWLEGRINLPRVACLITLRIIPCLGLCSVSE